MTPNATDNLFVAWIISGGLGVAFSDAFGIGPSLLVSSLLGAFLSPLFTERDVWWRSILIFIGAVFVAALLAGTVGKASNIKESVYLNSLAALISVIVRPAIMRLLVRTPDIVDEGLSRFGLKRKEPPQ